MAKCFIEECGLNTYTLRNNKGGDKFVDEITQTFEKAKQNAPAIIFLDDMDKFANDDENHRDAKEYVAIRAGFNKKDSIDMDDLINAVLRLQYDSPDDLMERDEEEIRKVAIHEAGHLVVSEVIMPGSVGLASIRTTGRSRMGGFIHRCKELKRRPHSIMGLLGGKVAVEMYYSEAVASGCYSDLRRAINSLRDDITENGTNGVAFLEYGNPRYRLSDKNNDIREAVVHSELERFIFETRNILIQNRAFLEKIADALVEKETLLYSGIKSIRESVEIKLCVA